MKQILSTIRRNTGLTQAESVAVATIAAFLFIGWIGRSLFDQPATHHTEQAERVIALLDSMVAQNHEAASPAQAAPPPMSRVAPTASRTPHTTRTQVVRSVDLNRATERQLTSLPGVGPATAARIIQARSERPFDSIDDLMRVKGIGPKKLEKMRPFLKAP